MTPLAADQTELLRALALDVGILGRHGDVEVGSRAPPPVDLSRNTAHDHGAL